MLDTTQVASAAPAKTWTAERILPAAALFCALACVWIVQNPSFGVIHDSQIYLIQALGRLQPDPFAQDIFLRYGSQDSYTVFSPLFAAAIRWLGVETAAATLTIIAHVALCGTIALLARQFMPARFVWLGLALIFATPCFYGDGNKFALAEDFLTPRIYAEVFVIAGLVAFFRKRFWLAGLLAAAGILVHPLMTVGGAVFALCTSVTPPRVRAWVLAAGFVLGVTVLTWLILQGRQVYFDGQWIGMLWGLYYLWITQWTLIAWAPLLTGLATLIAGVLVLERSEGRSLCRAALIAGVAGIALTFVGADLLQLVLVLQSQPWRWLWVTTLIMTLFAPFIVSRVWSRGALGRAGALLLVASWLFSTEKYAIGVALLALLATFAATRLSKPLPERAQRLVVLGAGGVLVLALLYHMATARMFARAIPDWSIVPWVLRDLRAASRSGFLPFVAFLLICIAMYRFDSWRPRIALSAVCLAMLAASAPASINEWSTRWYSHEYAAFAEWRALIPRDAEVLWFEQPTSVWLVLERRSYLSGLQEASAVFSREAAMAMKRRASMIKSYTWNEPGATWIEGKSEGETDAIVAGRADHPIALQPLCAAAPDLHYIVSKKNILGEPLATLPPTVALRYRNFKLYRCDTPQG